MEAAGRWIGGELLRHRDPETLVVVAARPRAAHVSPPWAAGRDRWREAQQLWSLRVSRGPAPPAV